MISKRIDTNLKKSYFFVQMFFRDKKNCKRVALTLLHILKLKVHLSGKIWVYYKKKDD